MPWNRLTIFALLLAAAVSASQPASQISPLHKQKYVMGTIFEIVAYDTRVELASKTLEEALEEIVRLDHVMSNYDPQSELSRLNHSAHFRPQSVSRDLFRVIEQSLQYSELSNGKFDITVGPLVDLWKAQLSGDRPVTAADERKARNCVGFRKILLIPPSRIEFRSSCLRLDLGAIGKGYAVDRAAEILRTRGIQSAIINAGGSTLYAIGAPPGRSGWMVRLRDPSGLVNPEVTLKDDSVSTSEQTAKSLLTPSSAGHIIDPRKGEPITNSGAVSVLARTATDSDALSTTLLLLGPGEGKRLIAKTENAAAIWISQHGEVERVSNGAAISISSGTGRESDAITTGRSSAR